MVPYVPHGLPIQTINCCILWPILQLLRGLSISVSSFASIWEDQPSLDRLGSWVHRQCWQQNRPGRCISKFSAWVWVKLLYRQRSCGKCLLQNCCKHRRFQEWSRYLNWLLNWCDCRWGIWWKIRQVNHIVWSWKCSCLPNIDIWCHRC